MYFIGVTMNKPLLGGDANLPIRAALNMAADREAVINIVNEGVSIPSDSIVPVAIPGYQAGNNPYPTDPADAQAKLDEFTGTLPTDIPFWFNSGAGHDKIAQALVAGWTKAMPSLTFKLSGIETNTYWTGLSENKAAGPVPHGLGRRLPVDGQLHLPVHHRGRLVRQLHLVQQHARSTSSSSRRAPPSDVAAAQRPLQRRPRRLILADAPCVPVYTYRDARVTNNRIGGFNYNPFGLTDMWKVWVK